MTQREAKRGAEKPAASPGLIDPTRLRNADICALWGVTKGTVSGWAKTGGAPRNADGTYDATAFIAWREAAIRKGMEYDRQSSPASERHREEQALMTRTKRLQLEGRLVDRDAMHEWFSRLATRLRSLGDALQRSFGREAETMFNSTLDMIEREVRAEFKSALERTNGSRHMADMEQDDMIESPADSA